MSTLTIDLVRAELDERRRSAARHHLPPRRSPHRVPRRRLLHLSRPRLRPLGLA